MSGGASNAVGAQGTTSSARRSDTSNPAELASNGATDRSAASARPPDFGRVGSAAWFRPGRLGRLGRLGSSVGAVPNAVAQSLHGLEVRRLGD